MLELTTLQRGAGTFEIHAVHSTIVTGGTSIRRTRERYVLYSNTMLRRK